MSRQYNRAFSLTWPASVQIFWNKSNFLLKKRVLTPTELVWNTNIAAVLLFWNINMATMTSVKTLYDGCHDVNFKPAILHEQDNTKVLVLLVWLLEIIKQQH